MLFKNPITATVTTFEGFYIRLVGKIKLVYLMQHICSVIIIDLCQKP